MNVPFLVKDIFSGVSDSYPRNLTAVGNTLYFSADDGVNGRELWKSDGTVAGTVRFDLGYSNSNPTRLTVVGSTLYFRANGILGPILWKSDGTAVGTVPVETVLYPRNPFFSLAGAYNLTAVGSTLFFEASRNGDFAGLWKSDGTREGTVYLSPFGSLSNPTALGNTLYFTANGNLKGNELWKSDGTTAGTILVKDIRPDSASSDPTGLTAVGNTLYFIADDGENGRELWKSDGTTAGTILVKNIRPGSASSATYNPAVPPGPTAVGNILYFTADDGVNGLELWKSDGTTAGTVPVKDIRPGSAGSSIYNLTAVGNTLYFTANDGVNGSELWKSDGTTAGTVLVKNRFGIRADLSIDFSLGYAPDNLLAVGDTLFFNAESANGRELWKSDGTSSGTTLVNDIRPGPSSSNPVNLTLVGNTLYFSADNGSTGYELWALKIPFTGTELDNVLTGTTAANILIGLGGNDTYIVDNAGDIVVEEANKGTDTIESSISYILPDNVENMILNGSANINATGNARNNKLTGNNGKNTLIGLDGNDILDGRGGADTMIGGRGNDTYVVETLAVLSPGDTVIENPNEGIDTVTTSLSYILPDNVENLTLTGTFDTFGIGNSLNNNLIGNSGKNTLTGGDGNDTLDGKAGADTMTGGRGNDTYIVDLISVFFLPGDVVTENASEGTDTVRASVSYTLPDNVENLILTGTANINGTGNALNNTITGNTGNNILNGGAGADTLTGGTGADTFVFRFGQSTVNLLGSIVLTDRITDFAIGSDKIDLLTQGGAVTGAPAGFTRAADTLTTSINTIVTDVFADANGATVGNQALGTNRAALVKANTATYLIVNDGVAGFQSANDLVVNLTGITGTIPAVGSIPVGNFFA